MIVLKTKRICKWIREWSEWSLVYVFTEVYLTPIKIVPARTYNRLVDWLIKQPCWSSLRWKSLT